MNFYKKHPGYRLLLKDISARYGKDTADKICADALRELDALQREYSALPERVKYHTDKNIFPRIAIYRVMQREMPGDALALLDSASRKVGRRLNRLFRFITAFPGMPGVFVRTFASMEKKLFGEPAGFSRIYHVDTPREIRFDITHCPYCEYCEKCGCPELAATFCRSDIYCYGGMPHIAFDRTETLGTGGTRCDFRIAAR